MGYLYDSNTGLLVPVDDYGHPNGPGIGTPNVGVGLTPDQIAAINSQVASLGGVSIATLVSGKIPTSQLPAIAISDVFPVANQAAMLALTAQRGDVAVRADNSTAYILSTESPTTLADWKVLGSPGSVTTVNGQSGVVTLTADNISDTASKVGMTPAERTKLGSLNVQALIWTGSAWPAKTAGRVGLYIGPDTATTPSDFTDGDIRLKYTP